MRKLHGIAAILVVGALWGASPTLADPPPAATSPEVPPTVVDMVPLSDGPTVSGPNAIMLAPVDNHGNVVAPGEQRLVPIKKSQQQTVAPTPAPTRANMDSAAAAAAAAASASGGFIAPGDYVDVILSMEFNAGTDENGNKVPDGAAVTLPDGDSIVKVSTETVLRNVKVLAIDQKLGRNAEEGPADVGKTATLEVSLADTEKLLTAARLGSLALVLRSMVVEDSPQDEIDAFEDPFNFTTDVATSRAVSAMHTTSSLYGYRGGNSVRVNRGGAISQEGN